MNRKSFLQKLSLGIATFITGGTYGIASRPQVGIAKSMQWKGERSFNELYNLAEANENNPVVGMKHGRGDVAQIWNGRFVEDVYPNSYIFLGFDGKLSQSASSI